MSEVLDRRLGAPLNLSLVLAVACGAALRIWMAQTSGFYLDEAQVLGISALPRLSDLISFLEGHESHPPGFYLAVRFWTLVFGDTDQAALGLSLVAGCLLVPITYQISRRLLVSAESALVAAWLAALSPTLVRYSGMLRPYAVLEILILVALYGMIRLVQDGRWSAALLFAGSGLLLVYIHNWAWLVLGGLSVMGFVSLHEARRPRAFFARHLSANLLIAALYAPPWLGALVTQIQAAGHAGHNRSDWPLVVFKDSVWVLTGAAPLHSVLILLAVVFVALIRRRHGVHLRPAHRSIAYFCAGTILLTTGLAIVLSPLSLLVIPHCFAILTPLVVVATAVGLNLDRGPRRSLACGVFAVCVGTSILWLATTARWVRSDMREIGAFMTARVQSPDLVLVYPEYAAPPLARYFRPPGEAFTIPGGGLPAMVAFDNRIHKDADTTGVGAAVALVEEGVTTGRRIWFVTWQFSPSGLPEAGISILGALTRGYGEPACSFDGDGRKTLFENNVVYLYAPRSGGNRREPPC